MDRYKYRTLGGQLTIIRQSANILTILFWQILELNKFVALKFQNLSTILQAFKLLLKILVFLNCRL